jgi:hypothetical protein
VYGVNFEGILIESTTNAIVRNNISYNNGTNYRDSGIGTTVSNNLFGTNPQFVSVGSADFHLQSTSPAKDAGMTMAVVTTDKDGIARPKGNAFDIGAYEFNGGSLPAPTGLRIVP